MLRRGGQQVPSDDGSSRAQSTISKRVLDTGAGSDFTNGANATPRTRRPALLARPVGNGMRNAALPQRATVELEFNFRKRMRMR